MKILFFLESLYSGGKERRAVELFHFLKQNTDIEFKIVLTEEKIHYKYILDLGIPIIVLKRGILKKDPLIFLSFFNLVKKYKPDVIHAWGAMTTLYAIPSAKVFNIPLFNGQIANAFSKEYRSNFINFVWSINQYYSSLIFANSKAGLQAYNVKKNKGVVIYNGIRLERVQGLKDKNFIKEKFNIKTPFTIIMVASFSKYKDHNLFFKVAAKVTNLRNDVTFIAVGGGDTLINFREKVKNRKTERIKITGKISNVEDLVNASDIGILFSNMLTGEGISNAIMEYMALGKPVIATDAGGTSELLKNDISGFLVDDNEDFIVDRINKLLDNTELRKQMGIAGNKIIREHFTIEKMGKEFVKQYDKLSD